MDRRALLAALILAMVGCGGGGGGGTAPPAPAVTTVSSTPSAPAAPVACTPTRLKHWYAGGVSGKKIAFSGDSTSQQLFTSGAFTTGDPASIPVPAAYAAALPGTTFLNFGGNGASLDVFNTAPAQPRGFNDLVASAPDLVIFNWGINDIRLGLTSQAVLEARLRAGVNAVRAALPNADIVLSMPNSFLSQDTNGALYVQPSTAVAAQAYSDIVRLAYRAVKDDWPNVELYDSHARLFGEVVVASSPNMFDQLHPSANGYRSVMTQLLDQVALAHPCP